MTLAEPLSRAPAIAIARKRSLDRTNSSYVPSRKILPVSSIQIESHSCTVVIPTLLSRVRFAIALRRIGRRYADALALAAGQAADGRLARIGSMVGR